MSAVVEPMFLGATERGSAQGCDPQSLQIDDLDNSSPISPIRGAGLVR
jgi:hypothetical protein